MGSRVFVRLFDGARALETDDVVLTLPPPPLKWPAVLGAMVAALDRADADDDDDDAAAAATVAPERLARARLFLLPSEALGIVAELNARGLRGIRENDRFVVCLEGEDYQKRAEALAAESEAAEAAAAAGEEALPGVAQDVGADPAADASSSVQRSSGKHDPLIPASASLQFAQNASFASTASSSSVGSVQSATSAAPPRGMGGFGSLGMKGNKRYRSISGKMAAIKSLGDKGLISADDRGHLKDLLLNNDSPQLQEALDQYNNTGDFQAVKAILMAELRKPSTKRSVGGDWISDTLVNDITANFNTGDSSDPSAQNQALPANPFMYQASESSSAHNGTAGSPFHRQTSPLAMGYAASNTAVSPAGREFGNPGPATHVRDPVFQPEQLQTGMPPTSIAYGQTQYAQGGVYGGGVLPHVNLPMRNRNSMNLMMKQGSFGVAQAPMMGPPSTHMDMRYGGIGGMPGYSNQLETVTPPPMFSTGMGYAPPDYGNRVGVPQQYGYVLPGNPGGFNSAMMQQQQQQPFGMTRFPYGSPAGMPNGGGGYDYYPSGGYGGGIGGGFDKSQMRNGGKWTTAPPMPSYPPACSKEEKKEKIAKWLKKRENRNWSNKPSYPVRHSIAKSRKRGEDGRFITKARLAEMALEAAAANGGADNDIDNNDRSAMLQHHHPDGGPAVFDDYEQHLAMASLPTPTPVP